MGKWEMHTEFNFKPEGKGDLGVNVFVTEVGCMDLDCVSNIFE